MENPPKTNTEKEPNLNMRAILLSDIGLCMNRVVDEKEYFKLSENFQYDYVEETPVSFSPENLISFFEEGKLVPADAVCRTAGDTTLFTTSGVQKLETIDKSDRGLQKENLVCSQPVIRSQFMDKIKEGTSSSFVNFSVELIDCEPDDFIVAVNKMISLFAKFGIKKDELEFAIKDDSVKWGDKKFKNTSIKVYLNGVEIGEGVYIYDYPSLNSKQIAVTDIGFGIERLLWCINNNPYFSEFADVYSDSNEKLGRDEIAGIIDPIRSMVLIAGEGVKGSNKNHGYRLRQFSKRFVNRNKVLGLDEKEIIRRSLDYWRRWGYITKIDDNEIEEIISLENQRNYNMLFLKTLKDALDVELYVEINQSSESFLKQIRFSLSEEQVGAILRLI